MTYTNEEIDKMTREEILEKCTLEERTASFKRGLDDLLRKLSKKHNCTYIVEDKVRKEEKAYKNGKVIAIRK